MMFKKLSGTVLINATTILVAGIMLALAMILIGLKNNTIPAGAEKVYLVLIQGNLNYDVDQSKVRSTDFTLGEGILSKEQYTDIRSHNGELAVRAGTGLYTIHPELITFVSGDDFIVPPSLMSNFPQVNDSTPIDLIVIKKKQGRTRP